MKNEEINKEFLSIIDIYSVNKEIKKLKQIVEQGADIHVKDDYALFRLNKYQEFDAVQYLVEQGANMNNPYVHLFYNAIKNGRLDMIEYYIKKGATLKVEGENLLTYTIKQERTEIAKYFIDNQFHLINLTNEGMRLLVKKLNKDLLDYILKSPQINEIKKEEVIKEGLNEAIKIENWNMVQYFIDKKANIFIDAKLLFSKYKEFENAPSLDEVFNLYYKQDKEKFKQLLLSDEDNELMKIFLQKFNVSELYEKIENNLKINQSSVSFKKTKI